jgi:hypothetical protein
VKNNDFLLALVFGVAISLGIIHTYNMKSAVDSLNTRVEEFINQDIETEYNYFLWLHEREDHLEDEEMMLYLKLKKFYKLPEEDK